MAETSVHGVTLRGPARPAWSWLALGTIVGPSLLTLAWIVLGLTRGEARDAWGVSGGVRGMITQPFSGLGIGSNGLLFNLAFIGSGVLLMVGLLGVFQTLDPTAGPTMRRAALILLALTPLGLVIDGTFTLQFFLLHMLGFLLGCLGAIAGFPVTGFFLRGIPRWRRFGGWLIAGSPLTVLLLGVYFANFRMATMAAGEGLAGLTERALVIEIFAWFAALGWLAFRRPDAA